MKKKLFACFFIILIAMISIMGYSVEAKSTLKITKKDYIKTGERTNTRFHTDKGYAFCITPRRNGPNEGATLYYQNEQTSGGLLYLLERAKYDDDGYLATQLAAWLFNSQYTPDYFVKHPNYSFVTKSKALASEAAKNRNYKPAGPSLSIKASSTSLSLTSDGKYYKSGVITVNASNISGKVNYQLVNAPEGAKIESSGTSNYVVIPAENITDTTSFTFKASASGKVNKVERYSTGNSSLQDLIVLVPVTTTVSDSIDLTVTPVKRSCEIVGDNYYDADGRLTDKEGYEASCVHKCVIYDGKYYDQDGKETDQATYELQCKQHSCEVVDGHYFDVNGNETTYDNYSISCEKHVCEIFANHYFGSQGTIVTENEYRAQCEAQVIVVPDTDSSSIISIIIGAALLGGLGGAIKSYRKRNA